MSIDYETMANTIRSRFKTELADIESWTTQYDNQELTPPEDELWVRWSVLFGSTLQRELGHAPSFQITGIAVAQIFVPIHQGDKDGLAAATKIANKFRRVTVSGITFNSPEVIPIGRDEKWWQINVNCPFESDLQES